MQVSFDPDHATLCLSAGVSLSVSFSNAREKLRRLMSIAPAVARRRDVAQPEDGRHEQT
jgi:hypothetical protein